MHGILVEICQIGALHLDVGVGRPSFEVISVFRPAHVVTTSYNLLVEDEALRGSVSNTLSGRALLLRGGLLVNGVRWLMGVLRQTHLLGH